MDSYGDPFGEHGPLEIDGFSDGQQLLSPQPGFDSRGLRSPSSMLGLSSQLPAAGVGGAAVEWSPSSSSPPVIPRTTSVNSFPDIAAHSVGTTQSTLLARGSPSVLGDTGQHLSGVPSPTTAWLTTTNSWAQQLPTQQLSSDPVRQSYRDTQRMIVSSQGIVKQQWPHQNGHQQQQALPHAMMPVGGTAPMSLVPVSIGAGSVAAASTAVGTTASQSGPATASQVAPGQDHAPREQQRAEGAGASGTSTSHLWQHQPHQLQQQQHHQQQQRQHPQHPAPHQQQAEQQPSWPSLMHQQQNSTPKVTSGAGSGKKKSSKGGSDSTSRKLPASAAAVLDFSGLWKPPPQAKEARIPKDPGVDYEDILPQGLDAASTRPLQIPADILQLDNLSSVLSIDTWSNVLDEQDRAQLRSFLPLQSAALNESSERRSGNSSEGAKSKPLDLADLLSGDFNFFFGNPLAKFWNDMVTGTANPRLRRQHEMVLQLRQQLSTAHLRDYHNTQVSTLLQMQRLWSAQLPADASTVERLALWKAAQHGDVGLPEPPAAAATARQDDEEEQEDAADGADGAADGAVDPVDVTDDEDPVVGGDVDDVATLTASAPPQLSVNRAPMTLIGHTGTGATAAQPQQQALQQASNGLPSSRVMDTHLSAAAGDQGPQAPHSSRPSPPAAAAAGVSVQGAQASHSIRPLAAARVSPATAAAAIAAAMAPSPGSAAAGVHGTGPQQLLMSPWQAATASRQHLLIGPTSGASGQEMGPKGSNPKAIDMKSQRAAATPASKVYPAIGASRQNVYVYEGPVDFSKKLTKRQAAAAAAAAGNGQQGLGSRDASPGQEAQ